MVEDFFPLYCVWLNKNVWGANNDLCLEWVYTYIQQNRLQVVIKFETNLFKTFHVSLVGI